MAKKFNKAERDVIIRKIENASKENYLEKVKELRDNFVPTKDFLEFKAGLDSLRFALNNFASLLKKHNIKDNIYAYIYKDSDYSDLGEYLLNDLKDSQIKDFPKRKYIDRYEIEDELILAGIDPEISIQDLIDKYSITY